MAPRRSIGFDRAYSLSLTLDFTKHSADLAFDLVLALDPHQRIESYASPPVISPEAADLARHVADTLAPDAVVVAVQADTKPEKMWAADRFRRVLADLAFHVPSVVVLDMGLRDRGLGCGPMGDRVVPCGTLPLPSAMALLQITDLFVGVDSCFLHAADLFGVPGVGLFGPTSAAEFGFRLGPHRHVCGPTMHAISSDMVTAAIASLDDETACLNGRRRRMSATL
jgi:ADP-heptose:LPS heptosyltransferase